MRTLLCLIVCLTMFQAARGQEATAPAGPAVTSGPQLIPALPGSPGEQQPPIREARLPRVEPTVVVPAAAAPTGDDVRRADHVEPAELSAACQGDQVGRALTIGLPGGFGVSLAESSGETGKCCCGPQWAQWWLDRVTSYLGGKEPTQPLATGACGCADACKCAGKCGCSLSKRCTSSCPCDGKQTVQAPSADETAGDLLPPCGRLCHVETAGGNYFGRLRSLTADWIVLDDEPNETCHWIPRTTLHCLSVYPQINIEVEATDDEIPKPDAVTFRGEQRRSNRRQTAPGGEMTATYETIPQPEPLPLHTKVVYAQGTAAGQRSSSRTPAAQAAVDVPQGKRLFTLGFPWNRVMQLEPGDRLDLITVLTVHTASGYPQVVSRTFAQNVEVADIAAGDGEDAVLTLLLTPQQCDLAAVAAVSGEILFSKRGPGESESGRESKGATLRQLLGAAIDQLDTGEQSPLFAVPRMGAPGQPLVPMLGGPDVMAMAPPIAPPHPGEFGTGFAGPPVPGCVGPECMGPAAGVPPYAAMPHGFMPPSAGGPMPFGPPPAMPTFAPSQIPAPELPAHDPDAPRLEPSHPTAPGLPAPKTVYLSEPPAKGKSKPTGPAAGWERKQAEPTFEPIEPAEAKPLKTSQALPGGRMIRPVAGDVVLFAVPPAPPAEDVVRLAVANAPAVPALTAKTRYQLRCVVEMANDSQPLVLTESIAETADEATTTIGELEFKFRVQPLERREVQLTFRDPRGMLQVVRAREGETLTLPWQSETAGRHGEVRVCVDRVTQTAGEVAAVAYREPVTRNEELQVRLYDAADLIGARTSSVPVLARSLYASRLLDDGPKTSDEAHAGLLNLVRAVDPDSWQPHGAGSVEYLAETMSLLVRQVPENHERIAELFDQLRAQVMPTSGHTGVQTTGTKDKPRQSSRRHVTR